MSANPKTDGAVISTTNSHTPEFIVVEGYDFPRSTGPISDEQARLRKLGRLRHRERKLLGRHHRANTGHDLQRKKNAIRACQGSSAVRICAAVDANKRLPFGRRKSLAEIFQIGSTVSWNSVPDEPVRVKTEPKRKGGVRTLCDFGIQNRAMQYAIRNLIAPELKPKPFQFGLKGQGSGVARAIEAAKAAILNGNVWAARLDIKDFFPSFQAEELKKMFPLLKKVVSLFAVGDHYTMVVHPHTKDMAPILNQAHLGGPQGSALSALLGTMIITRLDWDLNIILLNYVDDFLILGPSEDAVRQAAKALIAKVSALPGGHFTLQLNAVCHAADRIFFLGHAIQLVDGKVQVEPAYSDDLYGALGEMDRELPQLLFGPGQHPADAKQRAFKVIGDMWVFVRSWARAFAACDGINEHLKAIAADLEPYRLAVGCTWTEIHAYKNHDVRWQRRYS